VYVSRLCAAASEPTCSVNTSLPGNAVHESDFVAINCTIDYRGNWMPVVNCTPEGTVQQVQETVGSFERVSYIGMMAAADIGDRTVISCETTFVQADIPAPRQVKRVLDTPRYPHTWHTLPIRVFNTTGNTRRPGRFIKVSAVTFYSHVDNIIKVGHFYVIIICSLAPQKSIKCIFFRLVKCTG